MTSRPVRPAATTPPARVLVGPDGEWLVPTTLGWSSDSDEDAEHLLVALNQLPQAGGWQPQGLLAVLDDLAQSSIGLEGTGFTAEYLDDLMAQLGGSNPPDGPAPRGPDSMGSLARRFVVPPFSVLDTRQGYWQERRREWLALGIRSELGRGDTTPVGESSVYMGTNADGKKQAGAGSVVKKSRTNRVGAGQGGMTAALANGKAQAFRPTWAAGADAGEGAAPGTSIFDPVLCEIVYRWFSGAGQHVLDPFAGGSVRGVVAGLLGRGYTGVDLRPEQVEANRVQWAALAHLAGQPTTEPPATTTSDPGELTPVVGTEGAWVKRDDLFGLPGGWGGKVRSCLAYVTAHTDVAGLTTAGSRHSPQAAIVAGVAARLGVPCRVHCPTGAMTAELDAAAALGAEVVQHRPGYNTVIIARSREDAAARGWVDVPFGMETAAAVEQTAAQAANVPAGVQRIVVPVGSGMSAAGIVTGLRAAGRATPVLGIVVGADPEARLDRYCPGWRDQLALVPAGVPYEAAIDATWQGVPLDPHYEAKCVAHLQPGDLLWVVGRRGTHATQPTPPPASGPAPEWLVGDSRQLDTLLPDGALYDLLFTCPPYFDLEVYSDDPADLSCADGYPAFLAAYQAILDAAAARLRPDRFAVLVVSEVRDPAGRYRGLVPDTIRCAEQAGLAFYNEAILVNSVGSLPLRAQRPFMASRKLGRTHQQVLVFVKGSPEAATAAAGPVEIPAMTEETVAPVT